MVAQLQLYGKIWDRLSSLPFFGVQQVSIPKAND